MPLLVVRPLPPPPTPPPPEPVSLQPSPLTTRCPTWVVSSTRRQSPPSPPRRVQAPQDSRANSMLSSPILSGCLSPFRSGCRRPCSSCLHLKRPPHVPDPTDSTSSSVLIVVLACFNPLVAVGVTSNSGSGMSPFFAQVFVSYYESGCSRFRVHVTPLVL